jgi:hypothetical protein
MYHANSMLVLMLLGNQLRPIAGQTTVLRPTQALSLPKTKLVMGALKISRGLVLAILALAGFNKGLLLFLRAI